MTLFRSLSPMSYRSTLLASSFLIAFTGTTAAMADDIDAVPRQPYGQSGQQVSQPVTASSQTDHILQTNDTSGRLVIMEENDYFVSHDDKHYTQGARVSYLSAPVTRDGFWDGPYALFHSFLPVFDGADAKRKYEWTVVGQSIFTPTNTLASNPSSKDRPYAAWLYTGASFLQESKHQTHNTLENLEILGGVVGPPALGQITQNDFHQFINVTPSQGWQRQLHTEPGVIVSYERKWRFEQPLIGNFAVDAIPELGASGGNVLTYGEGGGMIRLGQNLGADYGADRIRPSLSGTAWFDPDQLDGKFGWYVFAGTQGRAVGYNIFLDGNTYTPSPSVNKKPLVADFMTGASIFWSKSTRADFTITQRTKEFYGQAGKMDRFGGINVVIGF